MSTDTDFLVIGSGPAGQKAAVQGAKAGKRVTVVEQYRSLGGICVHKGTIPSKALRESALRATGSVVSREHPTELAPLMGAVRETVSAHDGYIGDQLRRNDIEIVQGRATFVAPREVTVTSAGGAQRSIRADKVFIATGCVPRRPDNILVDHETVVDSDSVLSLAYLPQSMVVLGGGVIASEYATIFARLGCSVTMIDRYPRPLGFLDIELADRFVTGFGQMGGRFLGEVQVEEVTTSPVIGVEVLLDNGETLRADKMLVAQGRVASVRGLTLEKTGIATDIRGLIPVDANCQTDSPGVYAIGDVIGPPSLASAAMEQGRRAARHALGRPDEVAEHPIPSGIYAIPEMAAIGLTADAAGPDALIGYGEFREVARGQIAGVQDGMVKLVADPTGQRLLGVHIIGAGATELIHIGQLAMLGDAGVDVFIHQVFNFPTLAEAYRVAALQVQGQAQGARSLPWSTQASGSHRLVGPA